MASVLVVDDDVQLRNALARDLKTRGYDVGAAGSYGEAMDQLDRNSYDVLLTDLRLTDRDGMELITKLTEKAPQTRPILMSAFATAKDSQRATELGAVSVLCKPFALEELIHAVEQAVDCSTGFRGSVHGLSLVDILQMFHYGKRSVTLSLGGVVPAHIHMQRGEVVHAEMGMASGEEAFKSILRMPSGSLKTNPLESKTTTIQRSFESLLLDMLRDLDEQNKKSMVPSELIFGGEDFNLGEVAVPTSAALPVTPPAVELAPPVSAATPWARSMSPIDEACQKAVMNVDGAVACGVVDLDTGMLLGIYNQNGFSCEMNELLAAATLDLFRGPQVGRVEQLVRQQRGVPENGVHYIQEVQLSSKNNFHFAKTMRGGRAVIMLVTKKTTNLGLGWVQLNAVIPIVEPLVP